MKPGILFFILATSLQVAESQLIQSKLISDGENPDDHFGQAVSISDSLALVGAYLDDDRGLNVGAVHVFRRERFGWARDTVLLPSDVSLGGYFGYSVCISGTRAIVGAHYSGSNGAAYVYRRDGSIWIEEAKLTASDGFSLDWFGASVAISEDCAVVGAPHNKQGKAYVFRRNGTNWVEESKLLASGIQVGAYFGESVSISGGHVLVGGSRSEVLGSASGAAWIFSYDGSEWIEEAMLTASDAEGLDHFGFSVSIHDDVALVGAYGDDDDRGSAYVFANDGAGWIEEAKLVAGDGEAYDHFGRGVSLDSECAVIAAPYDNNQSGSAYIFRFSRSEWTQHLRLTARDPEPFDYFGWSVSMSGDEAIMGIFNDPHGGSAYICTGFLDNLSISVILSESSGIGAFGYVFGLTNNTDETLSADIWTEAIGPNGNRKAGRLAAGRTINPGIAYFDSASHSFGDGSQVGEYVFTVNVGSYPDSVTAHASASYVKTTIEKHAFAAGEPMPKSFTLFQNHPNPFNPTTMIRYALPVRSMVNVTIYNLLGQEVAALLRAEQGAGYHEVEWSGNVASGTYLYHLEAVAMEAPGRWFSGTKTMTVVK